MVGPPRVRGRVDDQVAAWQVAIPLRTMTTRIDQSLAGMDGPVRLLLERIAGPAAAEVPDLEAIGAAIADLAADLDYVMPWVRRLGDRAGSLPIHEI